MDLVVKHIRAFVVCKGLFPIEIFPEILYNR